MRGLAPAHPGGDRLGHPVADLVEVDDVGAVQNREVHDEAGGAVQFAQQRPGRTHQAVLVNGQRAEFHQAHAEFVVAAAAAQPAQLHQALEHPVCRGARQAGAPDDLGQRQPARPVECVEDQRDAVDDGASGCLVRRSKRSARSLSSVLQGAGVSGCHIPIRNICLYHTDVAAVTSPSLTVERVVAGVECALTARVIGAIPAQGTDSTPSAHFQKELGEVISPWWPTARRGGHKSCRRRARRRWHNPRRPVRRSNGRRRRAPEWVRR